MSISFYVNGYESKQKREKAIKARQDEWNKQKRRDYIRLPTFSVNYFSMKKPERLKNLDCDYRTLNEFNKVPSQIHIIVKQYDGNAHSDDFYNALAWIGLMGEGELPIDSPTGLPPVPTVVWKNVPQSQRLQILSIYENFKNTNSSCQ